MVFHINYQAKTMKDILEMIQEANTKNFHRKTIEDQDSHLSKITSEIFNYRHQNRNEIKLEEWGPIDREFSDLTEELLDRDEPSVVVWIERLKMASGNHLYSTCKQLKTIVNEAKVENGANAAFERAMLYSMEGRDDKDNNPEVIKKKRFDDLNLASGWGSTMAKVQLAKDQIDDGKVSEGIRFLKGIDDKDADGIAALELGKLYLSGENKSILRDFVKAKNFLELAHKNGSSEAAVILGDFFLGVYDVDTKGSKRPVLNPELAADFFTKAEERNHPEACRKLGDLYCNILEKVREAKHYYELAATHEDCIGAGKLINLFEKQQKNNIRYTEQDKKGFRRAVKCLGRGAIHGDFDAVAQLIKINRKGLIDEKNIVQAECYQLFLQLLLLEKKRSDLKANSKERDCQKYVQKDLLVESRQRVLTFFNTAMGCRELGKSYFNAKKNRGIKIPRTNEKGEKLFTNDDELLLLLDESRSQEEFIQLGNMFLAEAKRKQGKVRFCSLFSHGDILHFSLIGVLLLQTALLHFYTKPWLSLQAGQFQNPPFILKGDWDRDKEALSRIALAWYGSIILAGLFKVFSVSYRKLGSSSSLPRQIVALSRKAQQTGVTNNFETRFRQIGKGVEKLDEKWVMVNKFFFSKSNQPAYKRFIEAKDPCIAAIFDYFENIENRKKGTNRPEIKADEILPFLYKSYIVHYFKKQLDKAESIRRGSISVTTDLTLDEYRQYNLLIPNYLSKKLEEHSPPPPSTEVFSNLRQLFGLIELARFQHVSPKNLLQKLDCRDVVDFASIKMNASFVSVKKELELWNKFLQFSALDEQIYTNPEKLVKGICRAILAPLFGYDDKKYQQDFETVLDMTLKKVGSDDIIKEKIVKPIIDKLRGIPAIGFARAYEHSSNYDLKGFLFSYESVAKALEDIIMNPELLLKEGSSLWKDEGQLDSNVFLDCIDEEKLTLWNQDKNDHEQLSRNPLIEVVSFCNKFLELLKRLPIDVLLEKNQILGNAEEEQFKCLDMSANKLFEKFPHVKKQFLKNVRNYFPKSESQGSSSGGIFKRNKKDGAQDPNSEGEGASRESHSKDIGTNLQKFLMEVKKTREQILQNEGMRISIDEAHLRQLDQQILVTEEIIDSGNLRMLYDGLLHDAEGLNNKLNRTEYKVRMNLIYASLGKEVFKKKSYSINSMRAIRDLNSFLKELENMKGKSTDLRESVTRTTASLEKFKKVMVPLNNVKKMGNKLENIRKIFKGINVKDSLFVSDEAVVTLLNRFIIPILKRQKSAKTKKIFTDINSDIVDMGMLLLGPIISKHKYCLKTSKAVLEPIVFALEDAMNKPTSIVDYKQAALHFLKALMVVSAEVNKANLFPAMVDSLMSNLSTLSDDDGTTRKGPIIFKDKNQTVGRRPSPGKMES